MSHARPFPLTFLLRRFLDLHISQEQKDEADPEQAQNRTRTLWETSAPLVVSRIRVPGIGIDNLRYHLVCLKFDGIHWPRFAGKTGQDFLDEFDATPLGGVQETTSLSIELARLDGEGLAQELLDRLSANYGEEIDAILLGSTGMSKKSTLKRISWQDAAERMKRFHDEGLPFKSQETLAAKLGCSKSTIYKAIQKTPELLAWAKKAERRPKAQGLDQIVTDSTAQTRELPPEEDAAIREFVENADPETKAWFLSLSADTQIEVVNDPDKHPKILRRKL